MSPMRTTIRIDDELYRRVKAEAASTGRTVGELIEDGARLVLARRVEEAGKDRPLPTFGGSGLQPGVELDHNRGLLDHLERAD